MAIIIQIHQEVYGSLEEMFPTGNVYLTIDNSQSFKYKATLVGKTENAVGG